MFFVENFQKESNNQRIFWRDFHRDHDLRINFTTQLFQAMFVEEITHHLCSLQTESIWLVGKHDIDCDAFCQLDIGLWDLLSLCTCKCDFDECFAWKIQNIHRNCRCRNVFPSFCRHTPCTEYPKDDHLRNEKEIKKKIWAADSKEYNHRTCVIIFLHVTRTKKCEMCIFQMIKACDDLPWKSFSIDKQMTNMMRKSVCFKIKTFIQKIAVDPLMKTWNACFLAQENQIKHLDYLFSLHSTKCFAGWMARQQYW